MTIAAVPLKFEGELNIYAAAETHQRVQSVLFDKQDVAVDLSEVSEIDSAGLQLLLLLCQETVRAGHTFRVVAASDAVTEVLRLVNLPQLLPV